MTIDLPTLKAKQQKFVLRYCVNGNNASEAYRYAYDCSNMSDNAISVEACRLLKNPNIALWVNHSKSNIQQVFEDEVRYTAKEAMAELNDLQDKCMSGRTTYNVARSCIETKCKIAGLFKDDQQQNINIGVEMPTIKISGKDLTFEIGETFDNKSVS